MRTLRQATRFGLAGLGALILIGLALLMIDPGAPQPLLGDDPWEESTGFSPAQHPGPVNVRPEIADSSHFQGRWSLSSANNDTAAPARLRSRPFSLPTILLVPFTGTSSVGEGLSAVLECVATGAQMPLASRTVGDWSEVVMPLPPDWCPARQGRLMAESRDAKKFVGLGAPFSVSRFSVWQTALPALVAVYALFFCLLSLPFLTMLRLLPDGRHWLPAGGCLLSLLGLGSFFLSWCGRGLGTAFWIVSLLAMLAGVGGVGLRQYQRTSWTRIYQLAEPALTAWFWGGLCCVLLLYGVDNGLGSWAANGRFPPVAWSTDNQWPLTVAEALFAGNDLTRMFGHVWQVSDRPPLQAGLLVPVRLIWQLFSGSVPTSMLGIWYQIAGTICNTLWLPVFVFLAQLAGLSRRQALLLAGLALTVPVLLFNSLYAWPKLLAAALSLLAAGLLFDARRQRIRLDRTATLLYAALCAGALLAHGGAVFGLVIITLWGWWAGLRPRMTDLVYGSLVGFGLLLPWLLWQHFIDPPGNALMKFAFANTFGFDEKDKGLIATVADAYRMLGLDGWLRQKLASTVLPFGPVYRLQTQINPALFGSWPDDWSAAFRRRDFLQPFWALGVAQFLAIIVTFCCLSRRWRAPLRAIAMPAIVLGFVTLQGTWLITLNPMIVPHQSYLALLLLSFGALLGLLTLPRLWRMAGGLGLISYILSVWIVPTSAAALRANPATLAAGLLILSVAIVWILYRLWTEPALTPEPRHQRSDV